MDVETSRGVIHLALIRAAWSSEVKELYAYYSAGQSHSEDGLYSSADPISKDDLPFIEKWFCDATGELDQSGVKASRLQKVFDRKGASDGDAPVFHYAVETDPENGWEHEIFQWYDVEHMPGLAAVEGCVQALRFINLDHGPRSLACYDLLTKETLGSPPWLAIRGTDWSSRARPHFTNTKRTMFQVC